MYSHRASLLKQGKKISPLQDDTSDDSSRTLSALNFTVLLQCTNIKQNLKVKYFKTLHSIQVHKHFYIWKNTNDKFKKNLECPILNKKYFTQIKNHSPKTCAHLTLSFHWNCNRWFNFPSAKVSGRTSKTQVKAQ